jgi:cell division protein FtsB
MKKWKNNYKFWHSPLALGLFFCVLLIFAYKIVDIYKKDVETARNKELVLNNINSLKEKEDTLNKDIAKLNTEEGKEEVIREKLQFAKENEKMVTIVDSYGTDSQQPETKMENTGFWGFIKKIFHIQ